MMLARVLGDKHLSLNVNLLFHEVLHGKNSTQLKTNTHYHHLLPEAICQNTPLFF
jgi:hypothetical protein